MDRRTAGICQRFAEDVGSKVKLQVLLSCLRMVTQWKCIRTVCMDMSSREYVRLTWVANGGACAGEDVLSHLLDVALLGECWF